MRRGGQQCVRHADAIGPARELIVGENDVDAPASIGHGRLRLRLITCDHDVCAPIAQRARERSRDGAIVIDNKNSSARASHSTADISQCSEAVESAIRASAMCLCRSAYAFELPFVQWADGRGFVIVAAGSTGGTTTDDCVA